MLVQDAIFSDDELDDFHVPTFERVDIHFVVEKEFMFLKKEKIFK